MKSINRFCLIFSFILLIPHGLHAGDDPVISFTFENVPLIDVLDQLIYKQHIPIIYIKNQVDSIFITEQCYNCTPEEALKKILKNSALTYRKIDRQFILYLDHSNNPEPQKKTPLIEGRITDSITREPLPYASIVVDRLNKGSASNGEGIFKINNLPPDVYKLKILYLGYAMDSVIADLRNPKKSSFLDIKLSSKTNELDEFTIKSHAINRNNIIAEANTSVIDPKLLKTIPTTDPGDIVQNIKLLPGVSTLPDNLGGFNLRGGTADQTLIQIDGIPLFHPGHLWGFNSSLNADAIESVKVQSGGFSASYGDRLSGVIDLKGKTTRNKEAYGGISANLFSAKAWAATPIARKACLVFSINSSTHAKGLNSRILNREDYMFFNQYIGAFTANGSGVTAMGNTLPIKQTQSSHYYDIYGKLTVGISNNDSLFVSYLNGKDQINTDAEFDSKYLSIKFAGNRTEKWQTSGINVNNQYYLNKNIMVSGGMLYFNYTNSAGFSYTPSQYNSDATISSSVNTNIIKQWSAYANGLFRLSDFSTVSAGLEYKLVKTSFNRSAILGIETYTDSIGPINAFSSAVNDLEYNGFAESQLTLFQRLKLTSGIRLTYSNNLPLFLAEPRISSKVEILKGISVQALWGRFHQNFHNSPSAIAYNISSFSTTNVWLHSQKGLNPSQAQHWLVGVTFDQKKWSVRINGYYKKYSNLAFIIPSKLTIVNIKSSNSDTSARYVSWTNNRKILPAGFDSVNYAMDHNYKDNGIDYFTGSGYSMGLEIFATKKTGLHTGFVSYTISSTRYKFPYMNMGNEFAADYDRRHELKIMNSIHWKGWNLGCLYTLISGKPYPGQFKAKSYYSESRVIVDHPLLWDLANSKRTPAFQSVDLSLSKRFDKFNHCKLLIGTTIQNVFNFDNILGKYYSLTTDASHNNISVVNQYASDQKGIGRLLNIFISTEFY